MNKHKSQKIKSKIASLPDSAGVYKFLDAKNKIIYVGKAINLKKRVSSYFQPARARGNRLELLISAVRDIEIIRTFSEATALICEAGLIKNYAPRFNVELKDDKSYPFLKLTVQEKYPRLFITRRKINDGAFYYGPYVNVKLLKEAVSFVKKVFPLKTCRRFKKKVCLEYHINQCLGPCENKVSVEDYKTIVNDLKKFLEGKKEKVIHSLEKQMKQFSRGHEYEKALLAKKRIEALTALSQFHDQFRQSIYGELDELKGVLKLESVPVVIECFDVSNIMGAHAVASMVRFVAGKPEKSGYRRFKIKNVKGIDDYSMIREAVCRRYTGIYEKKDIFPDLVLIDGGKGHLFTVKKELEKLGLNSVPVASIAKEHNHLYGAFRKEPIRLSPGSRVLFLIQRIRDEAHRFAINYHRSLRRKDKFITGLQGIKGIGAVKEKKLLKVFGSINDLQKAGIAEIQKVVMDTKTARRVKEYLKNL
ncbi:MAG: excinuclease ABC subunit UvrC [Candidatus Omnitrophica bacterium]|nr:excinuclease ABC subunit UvrC [Candidatus Omnitrophota bacterium]